jgi:hypothetical protein
MAVADIDITSVPSDQLPPEPERGRFGRILSTNPAAVRARNARAARKNGTAPASPTGRTRRQGGQRRASSPRATARGPRSLYPELVGLLSMVNLGIGISPLGTQHEATGNLTMMTIAPGVTIPIPETRVVKLGDELDDVEISALAKSIDMQCQRSPRVRKYVSSFLGITAGAGLGGVVGLIVARRLARHGMIDPSLDGRLGMLMQGGDIAALASFAPDPSPEPPPIPQEPDPVTGETAPDPAFAFET